jgi:hypothetical protein
LGKNRVPGMITRYTRIKTTEIKLCWLQILDYIFINLKFIFQFDEFLSFFGELIYKIILKTYSLWLIISKLSN